MGLNDSMTPASPTPLLLIIGPSGSGKSTVVRTLMDANVLRVHPTWTTRPRRPDEADGSPEHRFVDQATFDDHVAAGSFLDTVSLFGMPYRYALPAIRRSSDGAVDAVMLRASLVGRFRSVITDPSLVFQIEDDPVRMAHRLKARATSADDLLCRLADNEREIVAGRAVADRVFVNDGTVDDLARRVAEALASQVAA